MHRPGNTCVYIYTQYTTNVKFKHKKCTLYLLTDEKRIRWLRVWTQLKMAEMLQIPNQSMHKLDHIKLHVYAGHSNVIYMMGLCSPMEMQVYVNTVKMHSGEIDRQASSQQTALRRFTVRQTSVMVDSRLVFRKLKPDTRITTMARPFRLSPHSLSYI